MELRVTCASRDETVVVKVVPASSVASLEASLTKLFDTAAGWGLYETATSQGKTHERWLDGRHALSWFLPITGVLEWRERSRVAEVVFLNGTRTRVRIDESLTVGRILQMLGNKLGLSPSAVGEYGIKFGGQLSAGLGDKDVLPSGWLDPRLTLQELGVTAATKLELRWMKRFFVVDHTVNSSDEVALHYSFLECKNMFLSDVLDTTGHSASEVAQCVACLLHVDHGRYDKKKHTQQWYSGKKYVPESFGDVVSFSVAAAAWKQLPDDVVPRKAFLDMCRKFGGFACTFFDGVMVDGKQESQVSVSQEKVVLYHPWSVAARLKNQRRLSRAALALSPRGGGMGDDAESPVNRNLSLTRAGSMSILRRNSIARPPDDDPDEDLRGSGTMAAPSPSGGNEGKSPRSLLSRTFTLRREKKASSPNLVGSLDDRGSISKSGRFKSFAGLRDLNLLKRGASKADIEVPEQPASPGSGSSSSSTGPGSAPPTPTPTAGASASLTASMSNIDEETHQATTSEIEGGSISEDVLASMGSREGRKEIRSIPLEDIQKWGWRGTVVLLEVAARDRIELTFPSVEVAKDFSDMVRGYCLFRLEDESPAVSAVNALEKRSDVLMGNIFAIRSFPVQLLGELHARLELRWASVAVKSPETAKELDMVRDIVQQILAGTTGASSNTLTGKLLQVLHRLEPSLPSEYVAVRKATEALQLAAACACPQDGDEEEHKPCMALESARNHTFAALALFAALSNGLRSEHNEVASSTVDSLVDGLLVSLDEALKRPVSVETHVKLAQSVSAAAPQLASAIRSGSLEAVRTCATYCRDALSDVLAVNRRLLYAAADGQNESMLKALWEVDAAVHSMTGCPSTPALLAVADACLKLAKQSVGEEVPACVDAVLASLRAATQSAVPARANAAKARASCVLLEELISVVAELASSSASLRSHVSVSVKLCQVRIEEIVERLVRHLLAGSPWEKTRGVLARLEEEMILLANVEMVTATDQKEWEESWKVQTNEVSSSLKGFKASFRSVAQTSQVTVPLVETWTLSLVDVVKQIRALIAPFFTADASAAFMSSSTAIVRAVQWMAGEFVKMVDFAVLHPDEKLADVQSALATDVDACLSALNANNPGLVGVRAAEAGRGWMRRGEISTQGAALKMKLTKKKAAASTDTKLVAGRKKQESAQTLDTSTSLNSMDELPQPRSGSGKLPSLTPKMKRPPSGEWEEDN